MNDALAAIARLGHDLYNWSLATILETAILLALAVAADLLLAKRVRPAWRIALYLPIFLRLILPTSLALHVPIWVAPAHASTPVSTFVTAHASAAPVAASVEPLQSTPSMRATAFAAIYLLGAIFLAMRWFKDTRAIARTLRDAAPHPTDPLVNIANSAGPMVVGVLTPRIIIPAWLLSSNALPLILAHEHAHITRRDPALAAAMRLACMLACPIIPIWIASARVRSLMEQACDERALCANGPRQREVIMTYADALIHVARRSSRRAWTLAFGGSVAARISALRHDHQWRTAPQLLMVLSVATMLIGCAVVKPGATEHANATSPITVNTQANVPPSDQPAESEADAPHQTHSDAESYAAFRRTTRALSVAPEDVIQPLVMLPVDEDFLVNVRILDGDLAIKSDTPDSETISILDHEQLEAALNTNTSAHVIAWPRVAVAVSQPAEVRMTMDNIGFVFNVVVYPSPEGTVIASVSYSEGTAYQIAPYTVRAKETDATVIRIPATDAASSRTLIITIERPRDDC